MHTESTIRLRAWQRRIFLTCWLTYASFYLCRVNLSVALPAIQSEFGWSKTEAGLIGSALFWVYACGQFVNGQLGDRLDARRFVAVGLLASVLLNVAFGFTASLPLMIFFWGMNGYFQSIGWGPIVRTLSRWFGGAQRGRLSALLGPSYLLGHVASWSMAGCIVGHWGWRAAFWVPAVLVFFFALHWLARIRNAPQDVGLVVPGVVNDAPPARWNLQGVVQRTFAHPRLRWGAWINVAQGFVYGGVMLWVPTYLVETLHINIGGAAISAGALPLCGLVGVLIAGWASDHFFHSRIAPMTGLLMAGLAASVAATRFLALSGGQASATAALGLIGVTSYGASSMLVTMLPLSLSDEGSVSSAAGFLDFADYVGAGVSGLLAGVLVDVWGWDAVFICWTAVALLGAMAALPLLRSEL